MKMPSHNPEYTKCYQHNAHVAAILDNERASALPKYVFTYTYQKRNGRNKAFAHDRCSKNACQTESFTEDHRKNDVAHPANNLQQLPCSKIPACLTERICNLRSAVKIKADAQEEYYRLAQYIFFAHTAYPQFNKRI